MWQRLAVPVLVVMLAWSSWAEAGGASKVGLIDTERLFAPTGIKAWADARVRLDAESTTFIAVEAVDGKTPPKQPEGFDSTGYRRNQLAEVRRTAWKEREREVLDPIEAAVLRELERYAKAGGIGLVLERSELTGALLVVAPGVELTDAFIKHYNAKSSPKRSR